MSNENKEQLVPVAFGGFKFKLYRVRQNSGAKPVGDSGRIPPAENFRAHRQMQFIHQSSAEQAVIELSAAFAEQTLHFPFLAQPAQRFTEINFLRATDSYL